MDNIAPRDKDSSGTHAEVCGKKHSIPVLIYNKRVIMELLADKIVE